MLCRTAALALAVGMVAAPTQALTIRTSGEPETVTSWQRDACTESDAPDTPARAFRDANGTVHLIASHSTARALTGPSLDAVRPNCRVIFQGHGRDDPRLNDDRSWISSFYTPDGSTVFALVSNEFHGQKRRALCPSGEYMRCWRNSITSAVSSDGGASFRLSAAPPNHSVATLPYPYGGDVGQRTGYFAPSNIVRNGGHWYAFLWAERFGAQQRGACLMQTDNLADPQSWRGWDGKSYSVRFVHEAGAGDPPNAHVCAPVAPDILQGTVRSVVRHRASGLFIATLAMTRDGRTGIWTTTSRDLVSWSKPELLWTTPLLFRYGCGDAAAFDYPALLDPASQSRNFEDVGNSAYVYMTRLNLDKCRITWNRDLVRMRVEIDGG
ncbi:hypothetical protein TSH100_02465 [Azospirillum sp. TSH100]|uniref:hypothetical protein n=1 Tax=Azospirillum sp. TSH100 TaxID=652764 RepID=UPI000D607F11|nr:hypothetical protein [Azospirillum sp. TSH100]PWC90896.1 hypothetical protein TSH100_02465 [Azospirillum sp. TSH100]QCG90741.1 hypothetical protein E6C72_23450 [Azospirillum sp. TSH100]